MPAPHRVYLVPGMFGFGRLAGYDYFHHVREALEARYRAAGEELVTAVVPTPPTSSLRFRARMLAKAIQKSAGDEGPIHLVGHSTGGLDIRLLLSPTTNLRIEDPARLVFRERVVSAVSLNTPHYGTPAAGYFATVSGTRVLYALSLMTVLSLTLGEPGLAVFSKLLAGLGGVDQLLGGDLRLVSRGTDLVLRFVARDGRDEITDFLSKVRIDQGGVVQLMPEAMDLFNAAAEDDPRVRYGAVATAAPPPQSLRVAKRLRSPYAAITAAMFSTLYGLSSQAPKMYPYAAPSPDEASRLASGIHHKVDSGSNDGVVPTLSMLWGQLLWCGEGDHLDVLGHFHDDERPAKHVDWVTSGAHFNRARFSALMDAIARFQLGH